MQQLSKPSTLRSLLMVAAILLMAWIALSSIGVLIPFIVGLGLAYIMSPLIRMIERALPFNTSRPKLARVLALLIIYFGLIGLLSIFLISFVPIVVHQITLFIEELPQLIDQSRSTFDEWVGQYRAVVPPDVQQRIDEEINNSLLALGVIVQAALLETVKIVSSTFGLFVAIVSLPVWLFYVLKDHTRLMNGFYSFFPVSIRPDIVEIMRRVDRVFSAYIRAQLILAVAVGTITWLLLTLVDLRFALVLGIIAGVTELIPVIGPILGAVPAVGVALATSPEKTLLVVSIAIVVQFTENNVLVPRIQSMAVNIHPAVIMVLLVIASQVAGLWGMLVAVPLAAAAREIYNYLYQRWGDTDQA